MKQQQLIEGPIVSGLSPKDVTVLHYFVYMDDTNSSEGSEEGGDSQGPSKIDDTRFPYDNSTNNSPVQSRNDFFDLRVQYAEYGV